MKRDLLSDLLEKARHAPAATETPVESAPPGFARGLVNRWLSEGEEALSDSWVVVSRRGLAVALGLMLASVAWHTRELRAPVLMESTACNTVLLSLYPQ
jgi:hypothetical protein